MILRISDTADTKKTLPEFLIGELIGNLVNSIP